MKIIEVIWRDAVGEDTGWTDFDEVEAEQLVEVKTAGYLIAEKPDCLTLALSVDETNQKTAAYITIPMVNVVSVRELQ